MNKSCFFPVTLTIMILCLGLMVVNWLIIPLPDWAIRCVGLLMLVDLPMLVHSRIKLNRTINRKKWRR